MNLYRDEGVVLRTYRLGEADRIIVLLTAGRGKVRAVAKGVRKTSSRFGSRLEPTSHVALQLYEGRSLDTVTQAEALDTFAAVRGDLDRLSRASTLLEVCDQVAQEGEPNVRLLQMLLGALRALEARDSALLVPAFFLKLLAAEGTEPMLDACAVCGAGDDLMAFDQAQGGTLCRAHRAGGFPISEAAIELCRRILHGGLGAALAEPASSITAEVDAVATRALEVSLERRLRSTHLLDC
ncbi:MAG: DNA repair protein RecO [Acidimicrobiales bacterium]